MDDHHFERTVCACSRCVQCCKRQPGAFAAGEVERLVEHVSKTEGLNAEEALMSVKARIWASPGSLVIWHGKMVRIGSITPRYKHGRCVFLDANDRCSIHSVAPFGCAMFDTHMPDAMAHPRSIYLATSHTKPEYQQLRATLPMATHYKPMSYNR